MTATIYFAGGEDIDFIPFGSGLGVSVLGGSFRSDFARCGVSITTLAGGTNFPSSPGLVQQLAVTPDFTNLSDFWFHAQWYVENNPTTSGYNAIGFGSSDDVWRLALRGTGTAGQLKLDKRNSAGTVTTLATSAAGALLAGLRQIDIHVVYGASGSIDIYLDGSNTAFLSYSGDVTTDGATDLSQAFLGTHRDASLSIWSEVIVADSNTRSLGLFSLTPQAPGNTQDWAGTVSDIDEAEADDGTWISTANAGDISEWTAPTTLPNGSWNVEAVLETVRVNKGSAGPQSFDFAVRPALAGADYFSSDVPASAAIENYSYQWAVNPDTSVAWVVADIGSGFNIGLKSVA